MSKSLKWVSNLVTLALVVGLLTPVVAARPPEPVFVAPFDVKGTVTGLAADARANFVAAVVDVDLTPGTILSAPANDVFAFDMGGRGLIWDARHADKFRTGKLPTAQVVAFASGEQDLTLGRFATGGPGNVVSRWNTNGEKADWEKETEIQGTVAAVGITPNGDRVVVLVNPTTGAGRLFDYQGATGKYQWELNLTDAAGEGARGTVIGMGRGQSKTMVVGTEAGIYVLDPTSNARPESPFRYGTNGAVTAVDVSGDGKYFIVGTSNGCFFYFGPATRGPADPKPYNRCVSGTVTSVAMTLDGKRFAVGTSSGAVHFFQRLADQSDLATEFADPVLPGRDTKYALGKPILSLDYDSVGTTLVAVTEAEVAGFHSSRVTPIWRVTGADLKLDAPLKGARVGDNGERIAIAGKTKMTAIKVVYSGSVEIPGGLVRSALPGDVVRYQVNLKNTGSALDTYMVKIVPPAGWTVDAVKPATLLPDESLTVSVNLTSPTGSPPGYALTRFSVESQGLKDQAKDPVIYSKELNVTLSRIVNVRLESGERGLTLNQGQESSFPFTIKNDGNSEVVVNLSTLQSASPSWSARFDQEQVRIGAGGSATGTLLVTAPQNGADGDSNLVTVRARVGTTYETVLKFTARVNPVYNLGIEANATEVTPRATRTSFIKLTITNTGNTLDTVNLTTTILPLSSASKWKVTLDRTSVDVPKGESRTVTLGIRPLAADAEEVSVTVTASSQGNPGESSSVSILSEVDTSPPPKRNPLPAPGLLAVALGALAVALLARRPRGPVR